ncbi:hypothetical protein D3C87_1750120 [compost metagenome]
MVAVERFVIQRDLVTFGRVNLDRQRYWTLRATHHLENLHQPGLVHDPVTRFAFLVEMETVEFLFFHCQLVTDTARNLEGFTCVQG